MDTLELHRNSSILWKPSPIVALATSIDESRVAAAREDGSLEIWSVSPRSVDWHCQLTIHGNPNSRVSSLVWCPSKTSPFGRLLSSSIDGTVSEWDLFHLKQKIVLDTIGVSIWQMAIEPSDDSLLLGQNNTAHHAVNGYASNNVSYLSDDGTSESDDESVISMEVHGQSMVESPLVALGCDDGCVRLYSLSGSDGLTYYRSLPRVSARVLSIAWSFDGKLLFSGSSDGFIRCWNVKSAHETYRITVGLGGLGNGRDICVWSLLLLRSGTLVSGDSSGSVQFWDSNQGTLLQAHSNHKGDVNALAAAPNHNRVFSAGSDGQVIHYKLSTVTVDSGKDMSSTDVVKKWVYVGYLRAHTHDIRALTTAIPIRREDTLPDEKIAPNKKRRTKFRQRQKPVEFSYGKWAHTGVPMLISAGDDARLFAYSAQEFTKFAPHDICPAPQRVPVQLVLNTAMTKSSLILVQNFNSLDVLSVHVNNGAARNASTSLLARVNSKGKKKIICSSMSSTGTLFAYSDHAKPSLFELNEVAKNSWTVKKKQLPRKLPFAHSMVFSNDSLRLIVAGHDRKIHVLDVENAELLHTFTPRRKEDNSKSPPNEPPITRMFTSSDGQWLSAVNCFGDIYVFNLEMKRQHWFISRLDGASVTAGGFHPQNSNVLVIATSSNQVYVFDVDAKQLGKWSMNHPIVLPERFQESPGEIIGLSFPHSCSTSVIIYSARAMCLIDFEKPVFQNGDIDDDENLSNGVDFSVQKLQHSHESNEKVNRKRKSSKIVEPNLKGKGSSDFIAFENPVLFLGHLSENSVLVMDKPWKEVVKTFDASPVHRHIFGT